MKTMKLNAFAKGLIMALVGFAATLLSDLESLNAAYIIISTAGFTIIYVAKNAKWPSISALGVDLQDTLSGLMLTLGMAISSAAAGALTDNFAWKSVAIAAATAFVGYFAKTLPSNAK